MLKARVRRGISLDWLQNFNLSKGTVARVDGGNYALNDKTTFDFGLVGGRFAASPRAGVLLGLSVDF